MKFPKDATEQEKKLKWHKIAEIKDADFGFERADEGSTGIRFSTRCVLLNEKNEICMIRSAKYGYMQIPGGGIDAGESIKEGLRREVREEAGWEIDELQPLGYIEEYRETAEQRRQKHWSEDTTFVYIAKPVKYIGTHYMEDEIAEGFEPVWMSPEKALQFKSQAGHVESYSGNFANMRDLQILKYFMRGKINYDKD